MYWAPQGSDSNLTHAVNMFCPHGDIAVISAGWRYDECELQDLQRKLDDVYDIYHCTNGSMLSVVLSQSYPVSIAYVKDVS